MVSEDVRQLVIRARRRMIATVMGAAENSPWWGKLPQAQQHAFRDRVLLGINTYHDLILDVISVDSDDRNADVIQLLQQVHASQLRIERDIWDEDGAPQPVGTGG